MSENQFCGQLNHNFHIYCSHSASCLYCSLADARRRQPRVSVWGSLASRSWDMFVWSSNQMNFFPWCADHGFQLLLSVLDRLGYLNSLFNISTAPAFINFSLILEELLPNTMRSLIISLTSVKLQSLALSLSLVTKASIESWFWTSLLNLQRAKIRLNLGCTWILKR